MNAALWVGLGVFATNAVWVPFIVGAGDVRDWLRRKFPTDRQRHTLPSVRADRWDSTESEVLEVPAVLRSAQSADWREPDHKPKSLVVPIIPGGYRPRHSAEDRGETTLVFEAIAADEGAPVRVHGPRETWLAELSVSAT